MQRFTGSVRKAVVDDFLDRDVPEDVLRVGGGLLQGRQVETAEQLEVPVDLSMASELGVAAAEPARAEQTAEYARNAERRLLVLPERVDARHDQMVQAVGKLELRERLLVIDLDLKVPDEVQDLFDVEGVAAGLRDHSVDEHARRLALVRVELAQLQPTKSSTSAPDSSARTISSKLARPLAQAIGAGSPGLGVRYTATSSTLSSARFRPRNLSRAREAGSIQ